MIAPGHGRQHGRGAGPRPPRGRRRRLDRYVGRRLDGDHRPDRRRHRRDLGLRRRHRPLPAARLHDQRGADPRARRPRCSASTTTAWPSWPCESEPGAHGLTLLPYLDGERTPDAPDAAGTLHGLTTATTRADLARAHVEGLLFSLADAVDALAEVSGHRPDRLLLIGGAARNPAVLALAPLVFDAPVVLPDPAEYVALGAARQAAWVLSGADAPPEWPVPTTDLADRADRRRPARRLRPAP